MTLCKSFLRLCARRMPIALLYFVIFAMISLAYKHSNPKTTEYEAPPVSVLICDRAETPLSKSLRSLFSGSEITLRKTVTSDERVQQLIGLYDLILEIPEDFDRRVAARDPSTVTVSASMDGAGFALRWKVEKYLQILDSTKGDAKTALSIIQKEVPVSLHQEKATATPRDAMTGIIAQLRAGTFLVLTAILFLVSLAYSEYLKKEVYHRVSASPLSPLRYTLEMSLGQFAIAAMVLVVFFVQCLLILPKTLDILPTQIVNYLCLSFATLGLASLIVQGTTKANALSAIINALSFVVGMSSGAWVPREILPSLLTSFSRIFPVYYAVDNCSLTLADAAFWKNIAVMLLIGLFCFSLSVALRMHRRKSLA